MPSESEPDNTISSTEYNDEGIYSNTPTDSFEWL